MTPEDNAFAHMSEKDFEEICKRQETIAEEGLPLFPTKESYYHALLEIKRLREVALSLVEPKGEA